MSWRLPHRTRERDGGSQVSSSCRTSEYRPHCGHGIVALATAAVELGWVHRTVPETRVGIDAPCGFIKALVRLGPGAMSAGWDRGRSMVRVDARCLGGRALVRHGHRRHRIWRSLLLLCRRRRSRSRHFRRTIEALKDFGMEVLDASNAKYAVVHPELRDIAGVYGTDHHQHTEAPRIDPIDTYMFAVRELDRSPTGSGTGGRISPAACPQAARHRRRDCERIHHRLDLRWLAS